MKYNTGSKFKFNIVRLSQPNFVDMRGVSYHTVRFKNYHFQKFIFKPLMF